MKSLPIIDLLNEIRQPGYHVIKGLILTQVHIFVFQRFEKALHPGVLIGVSLLCRADLKAVAPEPLYVCLRDLLHAPV